MHWPLELQAGGQVWSTLCGLEVTEDQTSSNYNLIDCQNCKAAIAKWTPAQHSHISHPLFESKLVDNLPAKTPFVCPYDPGLDKEGAPNLGFHMPSMASYMATCPLCRSGLRLSA